MRFTGFKNDRRGKGFTIVELLISSVVFMVTVIGILYSYLKCLELSEIGRNSSIAVQASKNKMEDIKNSTFSTLYATYNNTTFTATGLPNGIGVVYVNNTNPSLVQVKIVFCWKQPNGRLIGEDTNLNGVLNTGEDTNANGQLDSYVQMVTNLYG